MQSISYISLTHAHTFAHVLLTDEFCEEFPHNLIPTPGYWVECSRQKINMGNMALWPTGESDSEQEDVEPKSVGRSGGGGGGGGSSDAHLERGCSDLYEDDEDSEAAPR